MTGYILWPEIHTLFYQIIFYSIFVANLAFFSIHLYALKSWHCQFYLDENGQGSISIGILENHAFEFWRSPIVTVFAAAMFIEVQKGESRSRQLLIVWSDMFDDSSYRNLCRQLLSWQKKP
ncbi:protein YgfX [Shewanella donghaensis]|uniref:protein YgfX n=1 Tax=Shewanella donghaensis TaxID=238836 RepID=UPI0011837BD6|nr:protein YgfX [Shewanella donghaensis]